MLQSTAFTITRELLIVSRLGQFLKGKFEIDKIEMFFSTIVKGPTQTSMKFQTTTKTP